jgi:uncharacterized repeat protein (TIGR01451 family)
MARWRQRRCLTPLLAAGLALLGGCFGVSQNPSYFPYLLPTGDIIRTHAKPPGSGYFANFDPCAVRLEVRPLEATNPVRAQHVLIATVYDATGKPRRKRRVEWMLEGVGSIVEVDESGLFPGRGYKVDNQYAVSYTDYSEHRITRGNADPNDDFVLRPGQTWCVISSPVEGDTYVTVYAPGIYNWDAHKVTVAQRWVDAAWVLPTPAVNRAGTEHALATRVFRHTDRQPLAGYRVRYRLLDGPPAVFLPDRAPEAVATSDLNGIAGVTLAQVSPQTGVNRIGIEIIRPPDPSSPSGVGIVIGRGETTKEWQAPQVSLAVTGPPTAALGQEIPYTITVTNTGPVEVQAMTVRNAVPEGVQYVRSDPPAVLEGNQLTWTLGVLPPGRAHTLQVVFRSTRVGPVTNCAAVETVEGLRDEKCATTQIATPQLTVTLIGPATAAPNVAIPYRVTVTNPGGSPATNVLLTASFDAGLEHETRANPVELPLGTLDPGASRTLPLALTPRQLGPLVTRVLATADGNLRATAEHTVLVQRAQLSVTKTGPARQYVDRPVVWSIRVVNTGEAPLTNVVVRDTLPAELAFLTATDGGQLTGTEVVWNLGTLQPRDERVVRVTTRTAQLTRQAVNVAVVTADPGVQERAEAAIEILGVPAFDLDIVKVGDPVVIGDKVTYRISVTNRGSLPANQVEVIATVPLQMRVTGANGPSPHRMEGPRVVFPPLDGVQPQQTVTYTIEAQAVQLGDVRVQAELRARTLVEPVIKEVSTQIVGPANGTRAAPAPPPPAPAPGPLPPAPKGP